MKNLLIILVLTSTLGLTAQNGISENKSQRKELRESFTPEQKAELFSKRITLQLDLSTSQQKQVKQLFLDLSKEKDNHSNRKGMTSEDKFEQRNTQLDRRIAMKRELKQILTPKQFEKWEQSVSERKSHHKRSFKERRRDWR